MVYENSLKKVIYILGPTAGGKTDLAVALAKKINGEIIGADSMQIYKYISIGTAKPTKEEIQGCAYHLIDFVEPNTIYTVSQYKDDALRLIDDIHKRGKTPIVCGGTGLYANSVLYEMNFSTVSFDLELRKKLEQTEENELLNTLKNLDEETYNTIDKSNRRRVIRAIEICMLSGNAKSAQNENYKSKPRQFDHRLIILNPNRELLYDKINKRVDCMMNNGFEEEVKMLLKKYPNSDYPVFQLIGYKEMTEYLNNRLSKEEAVELMKRNTRRFAKRQFTWFRGITGIKETHWVDTACGKARLLEYVMDICR